MGAVDSTLSKLGDIVEEGALAQHTEAIHGGSELACPTSERATKARRAVTHARKPGQGLTVVGAARMVSLSRRGTLISYGLASCVVVIAYEPKAKIAAIVHILLPASSQYPGSAQRCPATYADTGVALLAEEMLRLGASRKQTEIRLVGGACMLGVSEELDIGKKNLLAVRNPLREHGLVIKGEDVGGRQPRTPSINVKTGLVLVTSPGRPEITL